MSGFFVAVVGTAVFLVTGAVVAIVAWKQRRGDGR